MIYTLPLTKYTYTYPITYPQPPVSDPPEMNHDEVMTDPQDVQAQADDQLVQVDDDPQPSGSGTQTTSSVQVKKPKKRVAHGPDLDPAINAKMPTLRDLITQAYDAKLSLIHI